MADADHAADGKPHATPHVPLWLRELPYAVVLILTLLGIAYTSLTRQPIALYWELLVPVLAVVCVGAGWHHAPDRKAKVRLVATQTAHWLAFLVGMNLVFLPSVQNMLNADATGLAILLLLALGTFIAGVHMPSWKMCGARPGHGVLRAGDRVARSGHPDRAALRDRRDRDRRRLLVDPPQANPSMRPLAPLERDRRPDADPVARLHGLAGPRDQRRQRGIGLDRGRPAPRVLQLQRVACALRQRPHVRQRHPPSPSWATTSFDAVALTLGGAPTRVRAESHAQKRWL